MIAGMVTPMPKAMDSPAEPAVWTMLFSRIVASRHAELRPEPEQRERDHRDGDRGADREADLEHEVERRRAEDHAQQRAHDDRAQRELAHPSLRRDVGVK